MDNPWWEQENLAPDLTQYAVLMRAFLEKRLTGPEFELLYLSLFKSDDKIRPRDIFDILDTLFGDIDDYCPDEDLRKHTGGIDERTFREHVRSAEERLRSAGRA